MVTFINAAAWILCIVFGGLLLGDMIKTEKVDSLYDIKLLDMATMACKAAVKGGDRLSREEAQKLIEKMLSLKNPFSCPHGRPTIIELTEYELEKKFKRIQ